MFYLWTRGSDSQGCLRTKPWRNGFSSGTGEVVPLAVMNDEWVGLEWSS